VSFEMGPEPQACPVRFLFHALEVTDHPVLIQQESGAGDGQGLKKVGQI
jgi:hypothetical protein